MKNILQLPQLGPDPLSPFPPPGAALESPNGLLAWGGDLHPDRLLRAYRQGIFPWYSEGQPILWWSPAPRCVLYPARVYLSRRTRRRYNNGGYKLSVNTAFDAVITACAGPRADGSGTWITPEMKDAYLRLHHLGHAHSLEVWKDERLAGGIYSLAAGRLFFGESMFSRQTDGSKIALVALCHLLLKHGYELLDCQVGNPHLYSMGAEDISREAFQSMLENQPDNQARLFDWQAGPVTENHWQERPG